MTTEPTSLITEEMVEKAARAIIDRPPATIAGDYRLGRAKCDARAVLAAVLPMVVERMGEIDLWRNVGRDHEVFASAADTLAGLIRARIDELEKGEK